MYVESVSIYILIDPRDNEIRYVGKTWQTLNRRLSDHCRKDRNGGSRKENWIAKLTRTGYRPIIQLLQSVSVDHWKEVEQYWIGYYRSIGCKLTNGTIGGDGGNSLTLGARQKLSASKTGKKRPPFNDAWKLHMSESHKGRIRTAEHNAKIGASRVGKKRQPFSEDWRYKLGSFARNKTHCLRDHEFNITNTRFDKAGKRYCRECDRWRAANRRQQIKI